MSKIGVGIGEEFPVNEPEPENGESEDGASRDAGCCGSSDRDARQAEWRKRWSGQREEWRKRFGPSHFWLLPAIAIVILGTLLLWGLLSAIFQNPLVFVGLIVLLMLFIAHLRYYWHDHEFPRDMSPNGAPAAPTLPPGNGR